MRERSRRNGRDTDFVAVGAVVEFVDECTAALYEVLRQRGQDGTGN